MKTRENPFGSVAALANVETLADSFWAVIIPVSGEYVVRVYYRPTISHKATIIDRAYALTFHHAETLVAVMLKSARDRSMFKSAHDRSMYWRRMRSVIEQDVDEVTDRSYEKRLP